MMAYELNRAYFDSAAGDDWDIPESGNGVPDILDEIKYELDWLLRMQDATDGWVANRVGVLSYNEAYPQLDNLQRYYTRGTTWATSSMAGLCAHGARLFADFGTVYPDYDDLLTDRAELAWGWLATNPTMIPANGYDCGDQNGDGTAAAPAKSDTGDDLRRRLFAAAELYKTTGNADYRDFFHANYDAPSIADNGHRPIASGSFDTSLSWITQAAMIVYASTAYTTDAGIVSAIKTSLQNGIEWNVVNNFNNGNDAYRAFMWDGHYCWGSNQLKAHWAFLPLAGIYLNVYPAHHTLYREIAEEYLHYFHGRNPVSIVYLTNMGTKGAALGADYCVMEAYHGWFHNGSSLYDGASSSYGQAPGLMAGGPNRDFTWQDIIPPGGQPPQKAFKDWNAAWNISQGRNENSWEVTEPGIYYQAKYCTLIGYFCTP